MIFSDDKPIYKQIYDYCCRHIGDGNWPTEERIPSVKELSVDLQVNSRTVLKAYEELSLRDIIYQKRGLGFFVASDASEKIAQLRRDEFFSDTLPAFIDKIKALRLSADEITSILNDALKN